MYSYSGYQGLFNATSSAIPWQAPYDPQIKKACHLNEKSIGETK